MSRKAVGCVVSYPSVLSGIGEPANADNPVNAIAPAATAAALADVVADVAVLVSDGASPTQEHVTALDGHMSTLTAAWAELLAGTGAIPITGDVLITYDTDRCGTKSVLASAVRELLEYALVNSGMPG